VAEKSLITNHVVNRPVANLLSLIEDPSFQKKVSNLGPEQRSVIQTAEHFVRQLRTQIERSSDPEVSISGLNQLSSNLTNIFNELSTFNSNEDVSHVINAGGNLDGALSVAAWAFHSRLTKGSKAYGESIAAVRKAAIQSIRSVEADRDATKQRLAELVRRVADQETALAETKSHLEQIRSSSNARLDEIKSEFALIQTDIEQERRADRARREDELKVFFEAQSTAAKKNIHQIEQYEEQAKKILQIVGNIGLTGNFQKRYSDESSAANFWRWVTVILFALGIGLIAFSLVNNIIANSALDLLFVRLAIGVAITLPAIYTARESGRHRTNADQAKQTELELASLTPFIEGLPEEDRWKIVGSLTPKYFGSSKVSPHTGDVGFPTDKIFESFDKLIDRVPKL
jgi:hypothetical protein